MSGFAIVPRAGDWSKLRAHMRDVLAAGDVTLDEYIFRWTAWMFQNPGLRAAVALVLCGDKGVGTSLFGNALKEIMGTRARHVTRATDFHFQTARFNTYMAACSFFFADRRFDAGSVLPRKVLKGLLSEELIVIESMGLDPVWVPNALHVLISSNSTWEIPVGMERRFVVSHAISHTPEPTYFADLAAEQASGGLEAMLHDMLATDLGSWHPAQGLLG